MNDAPILFPELPPIVENPYAGRVGKPPYLRIRLLTLLRHGPQPLLRLARQVKRKPSRALLPLRRLEADGYACCEGDVWKLKDAA